MVEREHLKWLAFFLSFCLVRPARAGEQPSLRLHESAPESAEAVLRQMTQLAAVIFTGEVIAVRRPAGFAGSGQDAAAGVVTVEFRVDAAVRGSEAGSIFTLREWAGLWIGGDRYRSGQRVLVFLHAPNRDGLSSPVGGRAGIVPLRGGGSAPGPYDTRSAASDWLADLRWVKAQAMRGGSSVRERDPGADRQIVATRGAAGQAAGDGPKAESPEATAPWDLQPERGELQLNSVEAAGQPLSQVLQLCRDWVRSSDGSL